MSFRWLPLSRRAGQTRRTPSAAQSRAALGRRRSVLEFLEDRTLLSNTIPLNSTSWTSIGPTGITNTAAFGGIQGTGGPASGRVTGIVGDPTDPNIVYVSTGGGGVWKTSNGGLNWLPTTDNQPTLFTGSIAISQSNPQVLYAGTGEANHSPDSFAGQGVLTTTDGGASWTLTGAGQFNRKTIGKIVVDPTDPKTVYAAVSANGKNSTPGNTGIYKSTDGGTTWTDTTTAISATDTWSDLVINPSNPLNLFAAVGTQTGAQANGVYETTDGGKTWLPAGNFLMGAANGAADGRIALAISASNPMELLASVANPSPAPGLKALEITLDGGATWNALTVPNYLGIQPNRSGDYSNVVAIDPTDPNVLYAAGTVDANGQNEIVESGDAGKTWNDFTVDANGVEPHTSAHALAFDAAGDLLEGNDGGVWKLQDATPANFSWSDINGDLAITQFNSVALDPTNPNVAYGGASGLGISKFNDNPVWTMIQGGVGGGHVAVDPTNTQTVYYEDRGLTLMRSDNGGSGATKITAGISPFDPIAAIAPFVIDPSNPSHLLFGTNRVYSSPDKGATWTPISTPNANGFTDNTPIVSLAIAAADPKTIYAATTDAKVFVTTNGGTSWTEHDIPTAGDTISQILVDRTSPTTAYAVRNSYNTPTNTGHVFETTDGGATWTDISGNLPDQPAWSVAVDDATGTVFVGTDSGVYAAVGGGTTWAPFKTGLPNAQVDSLELSPGLNILLAGTHGRGAFEIFTTNMLTVTPGNVQATEGQAIDIAQPVAEFSDPTGLQPTTAYAATISWGDATSSTSTDIRLLSDGNYGVFAPHTYAEEGTFSLTVNVTGTSGITGQGGTTVTVADAPLTASANQTPVSTTEGQRFSGVVGTFTDGNPNAPLTDFTGPGRVTIDWGDGTAPSPGTVAVDTSQPGGGFTVSGTHTYAASQVNATPTITVTVNDVGGSQVTIQNSASVADATLTPFPNTAPPQLTFDATAGVPVTATVASFTSTDQAAQAGYYDVKVDWGDGTAVQDFPPGSSAVAFTGTHFNVNATHTYAQYGTFTVTTTVTDVGPNGTLTGGATTTVVATANVIASPIADSSAVPVKATEGQTFSGTVATFTSSNLLAVAGDFQGSTVDWGDGTTSPATITGDGNGDFTVTASHLYAEEGVTPFVVRIVTGGSATPTTVTGTATISDAPITVTPLPQAGIAGTTVGGVIATFVDANLQAPLSDFTNRATINWGDGTSTAGGVDEPGGVGTPFEVTGTHSYATGRTYAITVTVNDVGGATDTESTTATITEGTFTVTSVTTPRIVVGQPFTGTVALLNTGNPLASAKEFIATINWGDGTFAQGVLTSQGDGVFTISSPTGHVYTQAGTYGVTVSVVSLTGSSASGVTNITVADAPIVAAVGSPVTITGVAGTPISGVIASFTQYAANPPSDFSATISWGDGTSSLGAVSQEANGTFDVSAAHLYTAAGHYTPQVIVNDIAGTTGTIFGDVVIIDPPISATPSPITAVIGRPFSGLLATVTEPNPYVTAGEFQATIHWGDGTPDTLGVISGSNGTFTVVGSHTFNVASLALPVTVSITHLIGGSATSVTDFAHIFSLLSGSLSTASDTGPSNHDGVTGITTPTFAGQADPGSTVVLYAAPSSNPSARVRVGSTIANALGRWSVQISPLAQGSYVVTGSMLNTATGALAQSLALGTGARFGVLTVDTQSPIVSAVSLSPRTGTLHVTFQTGPAGMYLAALLNANNYVFDTINATGGLTPLKASRITPVTLGGGRVEVDVTYNGGRALPNGGYVVSLQSLPLIDLAGHTLVEQKLVTFPQTGNTPNPNYVAQINVSAGVASAPFQYISLAEQKAASAYLSGTTGRLVVRVPRTPARPVVVVRVR